MHATIAQLIENTPVVLDGGWGTQLQQRGLEVGACPDDWNLTNPEKVGEVAKAYVDAGSNVILTNTFGASRRMLSRHDLAEKTVAINQAGVEISKAAAGDDAKVFASIGPTGVMLMMGEATEGELLSELTEQAEALAAGGADGIVIETMADPAEAKLAVTAAKSTGLPVVACMVFDSGADNDRTMMGTTPEQAAEELTAAGADVIGSNCGQGIEGFVGICQRLKASTDRPIWIKANAGLPEIVDGAAVYRQSPREFADRIPELIEAGAAFLGGCCGTTPDFIAAVKEKLG
jgi:5-methyltetrahydrofolate--homocysteine methyltransferase